MNTLALFPSSYPLPKVVIEVVRDENIFRQSDTNIFSSKIGLVIVAASFMFFEPFFGMSLITSAIAVSGLNYCRRQLVVSMIKERLEENSSTTLFTTKALADIYFFNPERTLNSNRATYKVYGAQCNGYMDLTILKERKSADTYIARRI